MSSATRTFIARWWVRHTSSRQVCSDFRNGSRLNSTLLLYSDVESSNVWWMMPAQLRRYGIAPTASYAPMPQWNVRST